MIDWEKVAKQNGLTLEEFLVEILTVASVVGAMAIDGCDGEQDCLNFACEDQKGDIELTVRRVNP